MTNRGLLQTLARTLDDRAEPGFPVERTDYAPQLVARYEARGRDLRAEAFTTALRWLVGRLGLKRPSGGRQARRPARGTRKQNT